MKQILVLTTCLLCLAAQGVATQSPAGFTLSVDSIMRGPELVGNPPSNLRWSGDSKELYFEWQMPKWSITVPWRGRAA